MDFLKIRWIKRKVDFFLKKNGGFKNKMVDLKIRWKRRWIKRRKKMDFKREMDLKKKVDLKEDRFIFFKKIDF